MQKEKNFHNFIQFGNIGESLIPQWDFYELGAPTDNKRKKTYEGIEPGFLWVHYLKFYHLFQHYYGKLTHKIET